ncbi:GNAT family N-acetyltransferase [Roseomonas sp. CAU 1739]|uniref:GNAT family N-acetyltransferase n=1 Tax=Roseomonas sp. CAU 1739 TaxID=3140364 RepID=UPI00325C1418
MTHIERLAAPEPSDEAAIMAVLAEANAGSGWPHIREAILLQIRDGDGAVAGGLVARISWQWLYVETLAVAPALRGQGWGLRLMEAAEATARERGCIGARLDTYSFQARGFYEKQGYAVTGTLEDCPPGHARYSLAKRFH